MTTALQKFPALSDLLKQPRYHDRISDVMRDRAPQYVTSIIQAGMALGKDCEPNSIIGCAMKAAAFDLPFEKGLGYCWAIPYKVNGVKYAQFQMGVLGYVQLALRTGLYSRLNVCEVYEGELEGIDRMTGEVKFNPGGKISDKIIGYVAYERLKSGFEHAIFWTTEVVKAHAQRYSQSYRAGGDTPWRTHFDQMAMKTVLSALLRKWGPMSIQVAQAYAADGAVIRDMDAIPEFVDNPTDAAEPPAPKKKPALVKSAAPADEPGNPDDELPLGDPPVPVGEPEPASPVESSPQKTVDPKPVTPPLSVQEQVAIKLAPIPFDKFSAWAFKFKHITQEEHAEANGYLELSEATCVTLLANPKVIRNVIALHGPKAA